FIEGSAERRRLAVELAPHAGVLRPLSGEEEDDVAPLLGGLAALDVGDRRAARDGGEPLDERGAVAPDEREAVLEVVAPDARRVAEVRERFGSGERGGVAAGKLLQRRRRARGEAEQLGARRRVAAVGARGRGAALRRGRLLQDRVRVRAARAERTDARDARRRRV